MEQIFDAVLKGKNYEDFFPTLTDEFSLPLVVPKTLIVIQKEGLLLPYEGFLNNLLKKQEFVSFDLIFEIYFEEICESRSAGESKVFVRHYFINIKHLHKLSKPNHRMERSFDIEMNKEAVQQLVAIARTAMLNYHQKHHITDLPKVKFIQQK